MSHRRQSGYSLAEMLTVIAIIGTLALVTVPAFLTFQQSNKMKSSMRNFTSDLRNVRQRAITKGVQTMLTYQPTAAGATQADYKRSYKFYEGNLPFQSTTWTLVAFGGDSTHTLESVVYFPNAGQTFKDLIDCSTAPCANTPDIDGWLDVVFFPDGRVQMPPNSTSGQITIQTDMRIPKTSYAITISPSGRVQAN